MNEEPPPGRLRRIKDGLADIHELVKAAWGIAFLSFGLCVVGYAAVVGGPRAALAKFCEFSPEASRPIFNCADVSKDGTEGRGAPPPRVEVSTEPAKDALGKSATAAGAMSNDGAPVGVPAQGEAVPPIGQASSSTSLRTDGCLTLDGPLDRKFRVTVGTRICSRSNDEVVIRNIDAKTIGYSFNSGFVRWCSTEDVCGFDFPTAVRFRVRILRQPGQGLVAELEPA
ncbi:MAG TPA: hypothetical protein PKA55_13825 [Rhodoblastus sp.]|nr:hypothetical protein [Rhodoblastus sp.]